MKSLLLKRLESSIYSFKETLKRMLNTYNNFLKLIEQGKIVMGKKVDQLLREEDDLESISETISQKKSIVAKSSSIGFKKKN